MYNTKLIYNSHHLKCWLLAVFLFLLNCLFMNNNNNGFDTYSCLLKKKKQNKIELIYSFKITIILAKKEIYFLVL